MISYLIQNQLEMGNWVVGGISDHLKLQLSKHHSTVELDPGLTSRSLAYYKRLNLTDVTIQSVTKGIDDLALSNIAKSAINSILEREVRGAQISAGFSIPEREHLKLAFRFIRENDNPLSLLLNKLIETFFKAENVHFRSASHPHLMGSIILSAKAIEQTTDQLAVSIIHEMAHQELYMLNLIDRLVVRKFDYNEIHAPFQGRNRPPIGRLHSMWALHRMLQFERKIGVNLEKHANLLKQNCKAFEVKELTEFGKILVSIAEKQVA